MKSIITAIFAVFIASIGLSSAQEKEYTHQNYFENYEGTQTCLQCHQEAAENFFHSQHYQWRGNAPGIVNARGRKLGKMNTFNDFCTSPTGNWIGEVKNKRGEVISRGCSICHAGLGKLPAEKMDQEQLENIDCLVCHASGYRRDVYQNDKGEWGIRPVLWKNREGLDSVSKRISQPTRVMCLRCHSASGGGPNYKRGDLEYKLADAERDYDVHMGTDGKNMQCVSCHAGEKHRVRGRGTDLSGTDSPGHSLSCSTSECHGGSPHQAKVLNRHTSRVNCTVCHIPSFAREEPTDMFRDWSQSVYNEEADKYYAKIALEKDVKPVLAWYNGKTWAQLPGEPARKLADGSVGIMVPQGSRRDPNAKLFAFKLHRAKMPLLAERNWLIPIMVEHFFSSGALEESIHLAAKAVYGVENAKYSWVETKRYMGIFHGVQPAKKALACLDCHGPAGRMDWKGLGYAGDPLDRLPGTRSRK